MPDLTEIPVFDVRNGGTLHHARVGEARVRALRAGVLAWFPGIVRPFLPQIDSIARRWLERSQSPYIDELRAIAAALGFSGIWFLNGSYQWSCTALACERPEGPWLARTLDWPFPGLGRYVDIVRMSGPAGEFFNVSWAGFVGALTACAPGRFAAAINQAPMRRRSHVRVMRAYDVILNASTTLRHVRHMPPDQLLRHAFESCRDYAAAKQMLETTPVARPVIFTLAGCRPGECCVIERDEGGARTREQDTCAANDWIDPLPQWEARLGFRQALAWTFEDAAHYSNARRVALTRWSGGFERTGFGWVEPPMFNYYTKLAVEMCPARGIVRAVGYEPVTGQELPQPVTLPREVAAERMTA